jgi:hypothetical protein
MKIPDTIGIPQDVQAVLAEMEADQAAQLTIADLKELGLSPAAALAVFNAARAQAQIARAVQSDAEDMPPETRLLQRMAAAARPNPRLAALAEMVHADRWLVLDTERRVNPEASANELRRLRQKLPARPVTKDGQQVCTPQEWRALFAEVNEVWLHPWKGTPLEEDGTDPHTGVSWVEETLWLRAAVARPEIGLAESAIAAQLAEPTAPWALAARARIEALNDEERRDLLRGRKRRVDVVPPVVPPVVVPAPKVERYGAAVAPWAVSGMPFKRMSALLEYAFTLDELRDVIRSTEGGLALVGAVAWGNPPASVISDVTDALRRFGKADDVLHVMLKTRRHLEPEIRAVAAVWDVSLS